MISVIVCSIDPDKLRSMSANISRTIGMEHEIIAFDNRADRFGISKVYNMCASRARFDCLCFAHEDIMFHTQNWGGIITGKLQEPGCGTIGFAGALVKSKKASGWGQKKIYSQMNFIRWRHGKRRIEKIFEHTIPENIDFQEVVSVDGLCMFVRREVWRENPFDEEFLKGFHGYDLDFCFRLIDSGYHNYVCNRVVVEHFSKGSYDREWVRTMKRLHCRWSDKLPLTVEPIQAEELEDNEEHTDFAFHKRLIRSDVPFMEAFRFLCEYSREASLHRATVIWIKFMTHRVMQIR